MASDADIVRCAAPWPGLAARVLEGLATLGPGTRTTQQICSASTAGIDAGQAAQILGGLAVAGLCQVGTEDDSWQCAYSPAELLRLANVLNGAEHFRRMRFSPVAAELAVTMPMMPSYLEKELAASLGRPGGFLSTTAAFTRIAQAAVRRLVVMTPYIDASGFRWLRRVFEASNDRVERVLVLRNAAKYGVELSVEHFDWIASFGVSIRDYHVAHDAAAQRALPIETFHSKVLVADDTLAYVGSANLLGSSEGVSLETGFVVEGRPAVDVCRLIEGVLRVARHL